MDNNPIVKEYVPYVVKKVVKAAGSLPENEEELIEFSQALAKQIIKRVEPAQPN